MNQADARRRQRRIFLLLSAILIPTAVLIILVFRVVRQEEELSERRAAEQRREAHERFRSELSARLQTIKLQELSRLTGETAPNRPPDSPVIFVTPLGQDRMLLPWEVSRPSPRPSAEFVRYQIEGESQEFRANNAAGAVGAYRHALEIARSPREKCEAQLWLGRADSKAGLAESAERIYRAMLEECDRIFDSDGIPFGLYAAERLLTAGRNVEAAQDYVVRKASADPWRSPNEAFLLRSLLETFSAPAARETHQKLSSEIHDMTEIIALSRDIHDRLGKLQGAFRSAPGDLAWMAYGDEPWLITVVSPASFAMPVVMAVSSKKVVTSDVILRAQTDGPAPLGDGFLDLQVEWPAGRFASRGVPTGLYASGLLLILGTALLAGYLLLRDVHREVEMAEMRAHFVASVSHELKTPLTAIRTLAETLAMGRAGGEQATPEYLRTIVSESERLSRLVDNVLDFSRIEQGRKIYRMQPTGLADVVRSAARAMEYPLAQLGFTLTISMEDNTPQLQADADADALQQAIVNLVGNAMKYSGDARHIEMRLGCCGHEAFIDVVDHGIGISSEDQTRIFEKFHRVRSAETEGIAGTGLGLALALHIVEAHRGRIELSSEVGAGSTFSLRIPLQVQT